jgi:hypothetical protein
MRASSYIRDPHESPEAPRDAGPPRLTSANRDLTDDGRVPILDRQNLLAAGGHLTGT